MLLVVSVVLPVLCVEPVLVEPVGVVPAPVLPEVVVLVGVAAGAAVPDVVVVPVGAVAPAWTLPLDVEPVGVVMLLDGELVELCVLAVEVEPVLEVEEFELVAPP